MLTACLLTGQPLVPRDQVTQASQLEMAARFLGTDDSQVRNDWEGIPPRALRFLRRLLVIDPEKRMTASEALSHSWYTEPATEAVLLEEGYQRVIRFWRKRDSDIQVIENIPSKVNQSQPDKEDKSGSKFRKSRIPDTTLSPYFSLDRHLNPVQRVSAKRKAMIDDLKDSGSHFLHFEGTRRSNIASTTSRRIQPVRVCSVEGRDLFRRSADHGTATVADDDLDEITLVPTGSLVPKTVFGFNLSDPANPAFSPARSTVSRPSQNCQGLGKSQRVRIGSDDPEETRMWDDIARGLPRWSSAKLLKDSIAKRKDEVEALQQPLQ